MKKIIYFESSTGQFHLRERSFVQWMIFLVAFWPFLVARLGQLPSVLSYTKYIADIVLVLVLFLLFSRRNMRLKRAVVPLVALVGILFVYTLIVYVFRFQSPFYFLWGLRNNFRFYVAFFAFVTFLDEADVAGWFKLVGILFWVNVAVSIFQFVFLDVRQDYLGGIFGVEGGANGYSLILFTVVVGKSVLSVFAGTEKTYSCVLKCIASLLVAAMAEMKFYFVVFLLLLAMASVFSKLSLKKFVVLLIGALAVMVGSTLLVTWFGSDGVLNIQKLIELATKSTYSSAQDLNRLSAIPTLANTIMSKPVDQMFGLGLGNCDTSAFAICNTPFYQRYSYLHYMWFAAAMLFLEIGYMGLVMFILFFVFVFRYALRQSKAGGNAIYCQLSMMLSVLSGILLFYNGTLRIEAAYMIYFVFAAPFICGKGRRTIQKRI